MSHRFSETLFTPSVQAVQGQEGSLRAGNMLRERGPANDRFGPDERLFIESRDGFYQASVSESGWPYVQFRGGAPGFLKVLDPVTLAYADVTGNRQYISAGNLAHDDRVALILMDYPSQSRLKVLGHAEIVEWSAAGDWKYSLSLPSPKYRPERAVRIHLVGFDWNCPQHITPRWSAAELSALGLAAPAV